MSTNPTAVELAALIRDGMSATFGLSDQAEMIADGIIDAGWVSPEEAKAREAAARREALLEVRRSVAVIRTPLNNLVGLSRAQAFHVGVGEVAALLDNTLLAEPERDEEGGR
jgi:hypothetical protein